MNICNGVKSMKMNGFNGVRSMAMVSKIFQTWSLERHAKLLLANSKYDAPPGDNEWLLERHKS